MNRRRRQSTQGFVLLTVVVMLAVLAALSLTLLSATNNEMAIDAQLSDSSSANYAAESGIEHAIWSLNQHTGCSGYTDVSASGLAQARYSATITPDSGSPVSIESSAKTVNGVSRVRLRQNVAVYNYQALHTVVIDSPAQIRDSFIEGQNNHLDHNKGDDEYLSVSAEPDKEDRSLLQFDLSMIPANVRIVSALLEIELEMLRFADDIEVYRLTRDWTEEEVTWETYNGSDSWNTPGGDFEVTALTSFYISTEGDQVFELTTAISDWVTGVRPNYGLILVTPESSSGKPNEFQSSDNTDSSLPRLTIQYACECGTPCTSLVQGPQPVAHWQFDEGSGLVATDVAGGHTGDLENGPYWIASGQIDGALTFDGLNDRVQVAHDDVLSLTEALTISAWINLDSSDLTGTHRIVSKESNGANDSFWLAVQAGQMWFGAAGQLFTDGSTVTPGAWHHVAVTLDEAGEVRMYFDGAETLVQSTTVSLLANSDPLYIGANWEASKYWIGSLDDVRLYDVELDDEQIQEVAATQEREAGVIVSGSFRDEFKARSYQGDDGTLGWSTDWLEVNEFNGPTFGDEQVRSDDLRDYVLRVRDNDGGGEGVEREADLSACSSARLSFDYRRKGFDNQNDYVAISMSSNGGASWIELERFEGSSTDITYLHYAADVTTFIANDTRLRFLSSPTLGGLDELFVDHVHVSCD